MPFRPSSLPEQIRSNSGAFRDAVDAPRNGISEGAAQAAKRSAYAWQQSRIRNPQRDSAAPWFSGTQPFSELVAQNPDSFKAWGDRYINNTDMGYNFAPPPPEPEPKSSPSAAGPSGPAGKAKPSGADSQEAL